MASKPPANLQPPPGAPSWYVAFCDEMHLSPFHPEDWSAWAQTVYVYTSLMKFRHRWRRLLADGDVALIRQQSGRAYLIRMVREELAHALAGPPPRSPWRVCACHPRTLGGTPRDEKGRVRDPLEVMRP